MFSPVSLVVTYYLHGSVNVVSALIQYIVFCFIHDEGAVEMCAVNLLNHRSDAPSVAQPMQPQHLVSGLADPLY